MLFLYYPTLTTVLSIVHFWNIYKFVQLYTLKIHVGFIDHDKSQVEEHALFGWTNLLPATRLRKLKIFKPYWIPNLSFKNQIIKNILKYKTVFFLNNMILKNVIHLIE